MQGKHTALPTPPLQAHMELVAMTPPAVSLLVAAAAQSAPLASHAPIASVAAHLVSKSAQ